MYVFGSTEKAALQEIGSSFTLRLGLPRTEFPAVRELGEPSAELEFGGFDDTMTDGERPEGKGTNQPPPEEVDGRKGEEDVEDGEPESKPRKETKLPAFDEYQ